jgi:hypothetical protein
LRYRAVPYSEAGDTWEAAEALLRQVAGGGDESAPAAFQVAPAELGRRTPIPFLLSFATQGETGDFERFEATFELNHPLGGATAFMAPVRTAPKRIYSGTRVPFTPEGDHAPYALRSILRARPRRRDELVSLLQTFGESSGLFQSVRTRNFGRSSSNPFEVLVELSDTPINLSNVGYGVSQCLPLVVQMLTGPQGATIAMQQPEVHLHPRAQAALGELLHWMASERAHTYIVETHSDYIVDRFRLCVKRSGKPEDARVLFFERTAEGNVCHDLPIAPSGQYPENQPASFRDFFINEQIDLLGV